LDLKRFAWVVAIFAGGLLLVFILGRRGGSPSQGPTKEHAASASATQPAGGQPPTRPATAQPEAQETVQTRPEEPLSRPAAAEPRRAEWMQETVASRTVTIGSLDPEGEIPFQVELISEGAAVHTLKLADHFATVDDKKLYHKDPNGYGAARRADPKKYKGHYSLLNPVAHGGWSYRPLATNQLTVWFDGRKQGTWYLARRAWKCLGPPRVDPEDGSQSVRFSWTVWRDYNYASPASKPDKRKFLQVIKTYTVRKDDYSVDVDLEVINHSQKDLSVTIDQFGPAGVPREDFRMDSRKAAYAYWKPADQQVDLFLKSLSEINERPKGGVVKPSGRPIDLGKTDAGRPILWLGLSNKFFGSFLYLEPASQEDLVASSYAAEFRLIPAPESQGRRTFVTDVVIPRMPVAPGQRSSVSFDLFSGPKRHPVFTDTKDPYYKPLYARLDYGDTIEIRSCASAPLAFGMIWLLRKLSILAFGNYGVAIILLVALVRLALHPLTKKGQMSMMKMQKLAPQMKKLQEKYKDDKESLNKEMMRLYKSQGASPFLGCLPMLLQFPIWIALFSALNVSVDLRHAALLPVWITDLAAPDALLGPWEKGINLPGFGPIHSFNLLPLLLTVAFLLQMKFNPQMAGQATASPDQAKQQKMMRYMMPAIMLVFFYNAPSGLTLYIMSSTGAGLVEQYVIRKHMREKEALEAAQETKVRVPGKGPRSSRPKKPKGPFWFKQG